MKEVHVEKIASDRFQIRGLPIVNSVVRYGERVPVIRFGGKWMEALGWKAGTRYKMQVGTERIVLDKQS